MSDRPPIPEGIKRVLRQEAYFGCGSNGRIFSNKCSAITYYVK